MKIKISIMLLICVNLIWAGAFDDRYPSVRATGMSNAYTAVADDEWAAYYNPAGLVRLQNMGAAFSYQKPFGLTFFNNYFLSAVMPLPQKFGTMGVSFETFGVEYDGNDMSSEYTASLSHGFYLLNDIHGSLSIGYNLKYFHWNLSESVDGLKLGSGGAFGVDIGMMANLYHRTYIGVFAYNLNNPTMGAETLRDLPRRIAIGIAYRPITELTTSISLNKTDSYELQVDGGIEYRIMSFLSLRLGAGTEPNRISAGFGVHYREIQVDYGFRNHPVLPVTHQFGLTYRFGNK